MGFRCASGPKLAGGGPAVNRARGRRATAGAPGLALEPAAAYIEGMRLASYGAPGTERAALHEGDRLLDLERSAAALGARRTPPPTVDALLREAGVAEAAALRAALRDRWAPEEWPRALGAACVPAASVRLGPPVPRPSKIVCVGLNYRDHALEQGKEPPEVPLLFAKAPSALGGPNDPVLVEPWMESVDFELELGVVIGRRARAVERDAALDHVAGYLIVLDMTDRAAQRGDGQWFRGKSHDTFAPCGPFLHCRPEAGEARALAMRLEVNGEARQSSSTSEMIHDPAALIAYVTRSITLEPGDILATGTPAGVGVFRRPPVFLRPGDRVRARIEGLGEVDLAIAPRGA